MYLWKVIYIGVWKIHDGMNFFPPLSFFDFLIGGFFFFFKKEVIINWDLNYTCFVQEIIFLSVIRRSIDTIFYKEV